VIRNARIIDGTGAPATEPRDILIERGRIVRIAPAGSIPAPPAAEIIEADGRVAIPGLIDLHAHHYTTAQLRGALYFGVTTFRGLGFAGGAQHALAAGAWQGPRMTASVRVDAAWPLRAMGWISAYGIDLVKIYSNSGWAAQIRLTHAAHAHGARVTGHCAYPMALLAAGIDSKEHGATQCTLRDRSTWYDDLIQLYARSGTPIVPTLALWSHGQHLRGNPAPFPSEVEPLFGSFERRRLAGSLNFGTVTAATGGNVDRMVDAVRKLHRAGALLGTGTDFELPDGLHYEVEALVEASLSPLEAIRAATSVAARIMGADQEVGQLALGFLGDIVILDADPTRDIRNTRRIWRVIQGGRIIDRQQLIAPGWDTVGLPP
jgi:imidazolonepropionase-like amidohydrolase